MGREKTKEGKRRKEDRSARRWCPRKRNTCRINRSPPASQRHNSLCFDRCVARDNSTHVQCESILTSRHVRSTNFSSKLETQMPLERTFSLNSWHAFSAANRDPSFPVHWHQVRCRPGSRPGLRERPPIPTGAPAVPEDSCSDGHAGFCRSTFQCCARRPRFTRKLVTCCLIWQRRQNSGWIGFMDAA